VPDQIFWVTREGSIKQVEGQVVGQVQRSCEECVHAAFDQGGVWCKEFKEAIHVPTSAAEDCGMYETDNPPLEMAKPDPNKDMVRRIRLAVDIDFYGKEKQGEQMIERFERNQILHYGDRVAVRRR
jgi:hypothetical protein